MEISVLMMLMACILQTTLITAKSNPLVVGQESKTRYNHKNSVSTTQKPELLYHQYHQEKYQNQYSPAPTVVPQVFLQPVQRTAVQQVGVPVQNQVTQLNPQSQQQIIQLIQRVLYNAQQSHQPTAMIIIAQPAYLQPNVVPYGNVVSYYNSPQARYQYVHAVPQQHYVIPQIPQVHQVSQLQQIQQQPIETQQSQTYHQPILPAPAQYQAKMVPVSMAQTQIPQVPQTQQVSQTTQTTHLSPVQPHEQASAQLQQIAQQAAQQYYEQYHQQTQPEYQIESENGGKQSEYSSALPPIITGFENFSPEYQEKIKAQLSAHFGAKLQPLPLKQGQNKDGTGSGSGLNMNGFVASPEVKTVRENNNEKIKM